MSAENVLEAVLKSIGIEVSNPQISSSDEDIKQVVELINQTGKDIAARADWARMFVVTTVVGPASSWPLPAAFNKLSESGAVRLDKDEFAPVWRVTSPEQFSFLRKRPSAQPYFYLANGEMIFIPSLDADGALVRYLTKNWADGKDVVTQNGDTLLIPERLLVSGTIYRWRRQKGLPYDDFMAEHEAEILDEIRMDRGVQ